MAKWVFSFFALTLTVSMSVQAEVGDISCLARTYKVTDKGLKEETVKELVTDFKAGKSIHMTVDILERSYFLTGDNGDYLLTQTWGPDGILGMNATGSFNSAGRMQISWVDSEFVSKLECRKILASEFPNE